MAARGRCGGWPRSRAAGSPCCDQVQSASVPLSPSLPLSASLLRALCAVCWGMLAGSRGLSACVCCSAAWLRPCCCIAFTCVHASAHLVDGGDHVMQLVSSARCCSSRAAAPAGQCGNEGRCCIRRNRLPRHQCSKGLLQLRYGGGPAVQHACVHHVTDRLAGNGRPQPLASCLASHSRAISARAPAACRLMLTSTSSCCRAWPGTSAAGNSSSSGTAQQAPLPQAQLLGGCDGILRPAPHSQLLAVLAGSRVAAAQRCCC